MCILEIVFDHRPRLSNQGEEVSVQILVELVEAEFSVEVHLRFEQAQPTNLA